MHGTPRDTACRIMGWVFAVLWLFVGTSSTLDAALTIHYAPGLDEQNPEARALIREEPDPAGPWFVHRDLSLLIGVKMLGTLLVLGVLVLLYRRWPFHAQLVVTGLSVFQIGLLLYLFH
jgi:hypothetical protein